MTRIFIFIVLSLVPLLYQPVSAQIRDGHTVNQPQMVSRGAPGPYAAYVLENGGLELKKVINGNIRPKSIAHSGNGRFFAQNMMYRHSVTVYDRNFNLIKTIDDQVNLSQFPLRGYEGMAKGAPVEVAFTPDGRYAWVSNYAMEGTQFHYPGNDNCQISKDFDNSFLYKINTQTLEIENIVEVGCVPKYVAVSPDGRVILATNWCSGDLSIVDAHSETEVKRIDLGKYPRGIVIDSKSRFAYITVMGEDKIAVLKLTNGTVSWIENIGNTPRHLCLGPDDRYLYVSMDREGTCKKIDLVREAVVKEVATGKNPRSMVLSNDGRFLYVANYQENSLSKVQTVDMKVVQKIKTREKPIGTTFDPQTFQIWVACYTGSIMVFEDTELSQPRLPALMADNINIESAQSPDYTYVPGMDQVDRAPDYYVYRNDKKSQNRTVTNTQKPAKVAPSPIKPKDEPIKIKPTISYTYYVIVGSYATRENAENRVRELRSQGFDPQIHPTEKGSFRVSSNGFSSKSSANEALSSLKVRFRIDAWIWRKKS